LVFGCFFNKGRPWAAIFVLGLVVLPFTMLLFGYARHWAAARQLSSKLGVSLTLHQW